MCSPFLQAVFSSVNILLSKNFMTQNAYKTCDKKVIFI